MGVTQVCASEEGMPSPMHSAAPEGSSRISQSGPVRRLYSWALTFGSERMYGANLEASPRAVSIISATVIPTPSSSSSPVDASTLATTVVLVLQDPRLARSGFFRSMGTTHSFAVFEFVPPLLFSHLRTQCLGSRQMSCCSVKAVFV